MRSSIAFGLLTFMPITIVGLLRFYTGDLMIALIVGLTISATLLALVPSTIRDELAGRKTRQQRREKKTSLSR